jgi:hypothetical protein
MLRGIRGVTVGCACLCAGAIALPAQDFKLFDRTVQVHGFASQGFVYTNDNNWLTMESSEGSGAFTDFGFNLTSRVTDKLFVGAQGYDRNLGQLGEYHPSLDWAVADYRFKSWFGIRGGKVKTTLGLYTDTQDLDFLRPFALLPQSVYPTDLREDTISHLGGDIYGNISLKRKFGDLSYTAYAGHRSDSPDSGYRYLLSQPLVAIRFNSYGGLQYGADLRWNTPLNGLLVGISRLNENIGGRGTRSGPFDAPGGSPFSEITRAEWTNQFYGQYTRGKLHLSSEYRRYIRDHVIDVTSTTLTDIRGWYVSGDYRIVKRLEVGSYYSRYTASSVFGGFLASLGVQNQTDTSLPANHIYDRVITGRVDLNKFWNVKVEGHFMTGYGDNNYPDGFYPQVNPRGFQPDTRALVVKTSFNF